MDYVNFWKRSITLAAASTSAPLDLADGAYRLVIADSLADPSAWEIVGATVVNGTATLVRGLEGTDDQEWPEGSVIYASVTAGVLTMLAEAGGGLSGDGVPTVVPPTAGATYVDKVAPALFVSQGVTSLDDWRQIAGPAYYQSLTFDAAQTPVAVDRWARSLTLEPEVYQFDGLATLLLPPMGGGAEALEKMEIRIFNPDSPGYDLQLDFNSTVTRLGLTGMFVETNLASAPSPSGGQVTFSLTGNHVISLALGFRFADAFTTWGVLRIEVEDLVELNVSSGPI